MLGVAVVVALTGCVDTTYDSSIPSEPSVTTSTTLPSGSAQDLWRAAQREVAASRPELLGGFESNVAALATAAKYNRAADADKAFKNLQALTDSFLATATSAG